jgi:hypothetical protein
MQPTIITDFNPFGSKLSQDDLIEFLKSTKVIESTLRVKINNGNTTLLSHILQKQYGYKNAFPEQKNEFTAEQRNIYRNIIETLRRSFSITRSNSSTLFYKLNTVSEDDIQAYYFAKAVLTQASIEFYKPRNSNIAKTLKLLEQKRDSVLTVLQTNFYTINSEKDRAYNGNPSITGQSAVVKLGMTKARLSYEVYLEVMHNLEVVKLLSKRSPTLFEIIDEPDLPLPVIKKTIVSYIVFSSAIVLAMVCFLLTINYYLLQKKVAKSAPNNTVALPLD